MKRLLFFLLLVGLPIVSHAQCGDTGNDWPTYAAPTSTFSTSSTPGTHINSDLTSTGCPQPVLMQVTSYADDATHHAIWILAGDAEQRHVSINAGSGIYRVMSVANTNGCNVGMRIDEIDTVNLTSTRRDGSGCTTNSPNVKGLYADFSYANANLIFASTTSGAPPVLNKYLFSNWTTYAFSTTTLLHGNLNTTCPALTGKLGAAGAAPKFGGSSFAAGNVQVTGGGALVSFKIEIAYCKVCDHATMFDESAPTSVLTIASGATSYTVTTPDTPSAGYTGYEVFVAPASTQSRGWLVLTVNSPTWGSGVSSSMTTVPTSGSVAQSCGTGGCGVNEGAAEDDRYVGPGYGVVVGGLGQDVDSVFALADDITGCTVFDFGHMTLYADNGSSSSITVTGMTANQGVSLHKVKFYGNGDISVITNGATPSGKFWLHQAGTGQFCDLSLSGCKGVDHLGMGYNQDTANRVVQSEFDPGTRTNLFANPPAITVDTTSVTQNFMFGTNVRPFNFGAHYSGSFDNTNTGWVALWSYLGAANVNPTHPTEHEVVLMQIINGSPIIDPVFKRVGRLYAAIPSDSSAGFYFQTLGNISQDAVVLAYPAGMADNLGTDGSGNKRLDIFVYIDPASASGNPAVSFAGSALTWNNVAVNSPVVLTLTNTGSGTLTGPAGANLASNMSISANFSFTTTCGASLTAGSNCTITAKPTLVQVANYTGTFTVNSNASTSPDTQPASATNIFATGVGFTGATITGGIIK